MRSTHSEAPFDQAQFFKCAPLCADLTDAARAMLARVSRTRKISKGATLFSQDDEGDAAYIVRDGCIAIVLNTPDGRELVINEMRAVRAAIQMIELITQYNQERTALKRAPIRIGIASGQVIAGYTGTQRRATYTCVGDTVNLAARLEAHTKVVGKPILIDANTRQGLDDSIAVEDIGTVELPGKTQSAHVYAVKGSDF